MNTELLFVGLPKSGKTTFIAALWYFVFKTTGAKSLSLSSISGENEYLDKISSEWLSFQEISRTGHSVNGAAVIMKLIDKSTTKEITLNITDFFGETFRDQFDFREWSNEFDMLLNRINGIVLFVSSYEVKNSANYLMVQNELMRYFGELGLKTHEKCGFGSKKYGLYPVLTVLTIVAFNN